MEKQEFDGEAMVGMQVYYYPAGIKTDSTRPYVGFIRWGHPGGVADITVLPAQEGVCDILDLVPHAGSKAAVDVTSGGLHPNAKKRGTWEFVPWVWQTIKPETKKAK